MKAKNPVSSVFAKAALLALAVPPAVLFAQTAAPAAAEGEEAIVLSPFEVSSKKDVGYMATSTLAGSRLNTELKDTAAAISVLTPEFLKDIGATNMKDVILFSNNAVPEYGDSASNFNGNPMVGNPEWQLRIRGQAASYARNYFNFGAPTDFYNVDRIDQSRGPNAILFGFGSAGGIVNTSTKQAQLGKSSDEFELTTGSNQRIRGAVDSNQVLLGGRLALRLNAVSEDANGWREFEYYKQSRAHLAAKFRVNKDITLRAEAEVATIHDNWARPWLMVDQTAAWRTAGSPVYSGSQWGSTIVTQTWSEHIVYTDNTKKLGDWNGLPFTYSSTQGWAHMAMTPENLAIIPINSNPGGVDADRHTRFHTLSTFLDGQISKDLSYEIAYNHQQFNFRGYDANAGNLSRYGFQGDATSMFADASLYAPTWASNPNAGKYYIENNWTKRDAHNQDDMLRATVAWHINAGKFGDHRIAAMIEHDWKRYDRTEYAEVFEGSPFYAGDAAFDSNRVFRRHYFKAGDSSDIHAASWKENISGMTEAVSGRKLTTGWAPNQDINNADQQQDTIMLATQSGFFNKRLIATAGMRVDSLEHQTAPTAIGADGVRYLQTSATKTYRVNPVTFTTGLVFHVTDQISLFGNHSTNRSLPDFNQRLVNAEVPPMPEAEGNDVGVKLDLMKGKLYATVSYYTTDAKKTTEWGDIQTAVTNRNTHILDGLKSGGLITQAEYAAHLINANGYMQDRKADGWEFSLIANPTSCWRVSANFSINNVEKSNIMNEVVEWASTNSAWWLAKAAPAGGANYQLSADSWDILGDNIKWMNGSIASSTAFNGKSARGERKYGTNLYTNYRFDGGFLKGFSIGGGGRYQSANIISMNGDTAIKGREIFLLDANMGYDFETKVFGKKTKIDIQLNVNNLLDSDRYQIYTTAWWDSTGKTPERIGLQDPRKFTLSARVSF